MSTHISYCCLKDVEIGDVFVCHRVVSRIVQDVCCCADGCTRCTTSVRRRLITGQLSARRHSYQVQQKSNPPKLFCVVVSAVIMHNFTVNFYVFTSLCVLTNATCNFIYLFIYLFAHKSTIIIAIKYVKQGRTARLTRALTAALKTTNSKINASSELKLELKS